MPLSLLAVLPHTCALPPPLPPADTHERLAALCPTPDGRLLLAAGTSGLVSLRWLHSLQVVLRYDGGRGPITALAITPEGCFLAGKLRRPAALAPALPRLRASAWLAAAALVVPHRLQSAECSSELARCRHLDLSLPPILLHLPLQAPPRAASCCSHPTPAAASPPASTWPDPAPDSLLRCRPAAVALRPHWHPPCRAP